MKRILIVAALVVVAFFLYREIFNHYPATHRKVGQIPVDAAWAGGVDGGSWFKIKKVLGEHTFEMQVFNESTGEIEVDTVFRLNDDCVAKNIDSLFVIRNLDSYDGNRIFLTGQRKGKSCFLAPK